MTTLVMPPGPTPSPDRVHTPSGPIRYVALRANLLPEELVASRRSGAVRRRVIAALGALVAVLVAWYGITLWGTSKARHDLSTATHQNTAMQAQQHKYDELVKTQQTSTAIDDALAKLMAGDMSWKGMLATLRGATPAGVVINSISGTMTAGGTADGTTGGPGLSVLNLSGKPDVGTLTITGTAADKDHVAAYVESLGQVKGLAAVYPTSATASGSGVSYAISALITSDALGGRFAAQSVTPGGK